MFERKRKRQFLQEEKPMRAEGGKETTHKVRQGGWLESDRQSEKRSLT